MALYPWRAILVVMCVAQVTVSKPVSELGRQTCTHKDNASNGIIAPNDIVSCNNGNLTVLNCYCATHNLSEDLLQDTHNQSEELLQVGACIFTCGKNNMINYLYYSVTNEVCASFSRTGVLCGSCLPGYYVSAYSFDLKCKKVVTKWIWYIMAAYLPLTLFYFIVLFFKVNVVSGYLHPVAFFGQAIVVPPLVRVLFRSIQENQSLWYITKVFSSFYGIWSLDFFKPFYSNFCLGIDILPTLALDYVIAVYPLLLMIITYLLIVLYDRNYRVVTIMWRPFQLIFSLFRRNWNIRTSVIDAYATFFLLSYMKFLNTSFDLLVPTKVYHLSTDNYTHTWALFYAGDIKYFGKEHLPYGILAIAVMCVFVILPTVTLALYPFSFFQKFLNLFPFQWNVLHMFMDSFHGCYKNGTEPGTRDYRWFSAAYLVLRWVFFSLYGFTLGPTFFPLISLLIFFFIVILAIFQPYKTSLHFKVNLGLLAALAAFCMALYGQINARTHSFAIFFFVVSILLASVPLLFIIVLIFHAIISRWTFFFELVYRIRSWCQRHNDSDAEAVDSDRVVNPQEYPAIPVRRYNSLVDLLKED